VPPPSLDQHLRLAQAVEDLPIQQLVPELAVERLGSALTARGAAAQQRELVLRVLTRNLALLADGG
jgi:hypothetical protein